MIIWKKCSLPTRAEKEAAAKKQAEKDGLPDRVAEVEDAMLSLIHISEPTRH